jgi:hypothetical protein
LLEIGHPCLVFCHFIQQGVGTLYSWLILQFAYPAARPLQFKLRRWPTRS